MQDAMRKIGFFLLALACAPARAEWVEVAPADEDLGTFYIDPASIDSFGASMRWAWQMQDLKKPAEDGFASYAGLVEFDCQGQRTRPIQTYFYAGHRASGEVVRKTGESVKWTPVEPGTAADRMLKFTCAH